MKDTLFDEKGHLSIEAVERLKDGSLDDCNMILVSEHICECESCANYFADSFEENELVHVPFGFEEELQSKIVNKRRGNKDFIFYSLKVGIVVCIALVIVFSNVFNVVINNQIKNYGNISNLNVSNSINNKLVDFSHKVVNMEVFKHAKQKK